MLIVAYSYGCILTLEMLAALEKDGYTALVILVDGASDMLNTFIEQQVGSVDDLPTFETNILSAIMSQFMTMEVIAQRRVTSRFTPPHLHHTTFSSGGVTRM